jgi:hypothetical protein
VSPIVTLAHMSVYSRRRRTDRIRAHDALLPALVSFGTACAARAQRPPARGEAWLLRGLAAMALGTCATGAAGASRIFA